MLNLLYFVNTPLKNIDISNNKTREEVAEKEDDNEVDDDDEKLLRQNSFIQIVSMSKTAEPLLKYKLQKIFISDKTTVLYSACKSLKSDILHLKSLRRTYKKCKNIAFGGAEICTFKYAFGFNGTCTARKILV